MAADAAIEIPALTWRRLVSQLQKRGRSRRESGAFLLGKPDGGRVTSFVCYDDLDPDALSTGVVMFHGSGFAALWDLCAKRQLSVLADVHTHPGPDVRQSSVDKRNPMLPVAGHVALILPNFGHTSKWSLAGVGIHVFQGKAQWAAYSVRQSNAPVRLSLW